MKKYFLLLFFYPFIVLSQTPTIQWQKVYGGISTEALYSISQTPDGGFILAGKSFSNAYFIGDITMSSVGGADVWVVKTSSLGIIEWQRKIRGSSMNDSFPKIRPTSDGGYILGIDSDSVLGYDKTEPSKGSSDYWILKLDHLGNIVWQKSIGGAGPESFTNIEQTNDGGYIISGDSSSTLSGDKTENRINNSDDYWIVKLDAFGNIMWDNTIGGNFNEDNSNIKQTLDGGFIISGFSDSNASVDKTENSYGGYDYWIVKLDSNGIVQWDKTLGGDFQDYCTSIAQSNDGSYYIAGYSYSGISGLKSEPNNQGDLWIIKLDNSGNLLWENSIGGNYADLFPILNVTNDGNAIIICNSYSDISGDKTENNRGVSVTTFTEQATPDYWLIKIDASGIIQWDKTIGGSKQDLNCRDIQQTSDSGFIIGGNSNSPISGEKTIVNYGISNFWVLKLSPENLSNHGFDFQTISLYPNPTTGIVNINLGQTQQKITLTLTNILGQLVSTKTYSQIENVTYEINGEAGMYLLTIVNEMGEKKTIKVIKQ
jgi:hypothetical protein